MNVRPTRLDRERSESETRIAELEAENERLRQELADTRDGLRLSIANRRARPWAIISDSDVNSYVDFIRGQRSRETAKVAKETS